MIINKKTYEKAMDYLSEEGWLNLGEKGRVIAYLDYKELNIHTCDTEMLYDISTHGLTIEDVEKVHKFCNQMDNEFQRFIDKDRYLFSGTTNN